LREKWESEFVWERKGGVAVVPEYPCQCIDYLQILQLHLEHFKAHHQIQFHFLPVDELLMPPLLPLRDA